MSLSPLETNTYLYRGRRWASTSGYVGVSARELIRTVWGHTGGALEQLAMQIAGTFRLPGERDKALRVRVLHTRGIYPVFNSDEEFVDKIEESL